MISNSTYPSCATVTREIYTVGTPHKNQTTRKLPRSYSILCNTRLSQPRPFIPHLHHPPSTQHLPTINNKRSPINVSTRPARKKNHRTSNILRLSQPPTRILPCQRRLPTTHLHKSI